MIKKFVVLACVCMIAMLIGCSAEQGSNGDSQKQGQQQQEQQQQQPVEQSNESASDLASEVVSSQLDRSPPVIDELDVYPYPVPSTWKQEKFEVRQYDEGMNWETVFTFSGDVTEEAIAYKQIIEELGYDTQALFSQVFKIGEAELAGVTYHGTFTFGLGDEYSEWGEGQGYVAISFSEKQ